MHFKNDWSRFRIVFSITNALSLEMITYKYGHNSNIPLTILLRGKKRKKKRIQAVNNLNRDTKKNKRKKKKYVTQKCQLLVKARVQNDCMKMCVVKPKKK